ncbi:TIGR02677 family protein [Paenibacillus rigui]|uniref:TIGR02677 family protein n=1 Tax=Paenibacillus rigui TaxID=554312 RepID=A0A229UUK1_9BACL|nr:TIGR02677 family protein [Paenibacillus rigui]OXM87013.1 TIGR02677 family protein [Paenibacillus rigui]
MNLFNRLEQFTYLVANQRTDRYRPIARILYEHHRTFRSMLTMEDIYSALKQMDDFVERFPDYSIEELEMDLGAMKEWGNIEISQQENVKYAAYEDFKRKKHLIRATDALIDVEEIITTMERRANRVRGSLEKNLAARIIEELDRFKSATTKEPSELYNLWNEIMGRHDRLRIDTSNYLSHVNSSDMEAAYLSDQFLEHKNKFVSYLDEFVRDIQKQQVRILKKLLSISKEYLDDVIYLIVDYEINRIQLPTLEGTNQEEHVELHKKQWQSMINWFVSESSQEGGYYFLMEQTKNAISKVLRLSRQVSDRLFHYTNRKHDYLHLANLFFKAEDDEECKELFGYIRGIGPASQMVITEIQTTDSETKSVWELPAEQIELIPHKKREFIKRVKSPLLEDPLERRRIEMEHKEQEELLRIEMESISSDGRIRIRDLDEISPALRDTLLFIETEGLRHHDVAYLPDGREFRAFVVSEDRIKMKCTDGELTMDDIEIVLEDGASND